MATVFLANLLFRRDSRVWRSALVAEAPSHSTPIAPLGASAMPVSRRLALSHARRVRGHPVPGRKVRFPLLENLRCPDYIGCGQRPLVCLPPNPLSCAIGLRPKDTLRGALSTGARKKWERRGLTFAVLRTAAVRETGSPSGVVITWGGVPSAMEHASVILGGKDPARLMRKEYNSFVGRDLPVWAINGCASVPLGFRKVHRQSSGRFTVRSPPVMAAGLSVSPTGWLASGLFRRSPRRPPQRRPVPLCPDPRLELVRSSPAGDELRMLVMMSRRSSPCCFIQDLGFLTLFLLR